MLSKSKRFVTTYVVLHPLGQPVHHHPHALVNVLLKGAFFLIQRLLPQINDGGRILNLSSGLARFALPGYAAYAAMKGAVEVLSRYLAQELGPRGIAVNVVASCEIMLLMRLASWRHNRLAALFYELMRLIHLK